jgi:hypothetical protein
MAAPVESSSSSASSSSATSSASSVSGKQLRANRRNAQRSTGPRTDEGKAASARNATTHGAFCADLLLPGEDAEELLALKRGIESALSPGDAIERELADRIAATQWRLRRLRGAERAALLRTQPPATPTSAQRALDRAMRFAQETAERFREYGWDPELAKAEIAAVAEEDAKVPPDSAPGELLAKEFGYYGSGTLERISRYQQRLEQSIHRAMRELRQWRKDKRELGEKPPCADNGGVELCGDDEARDAGDDLRDDVCDQAARAEMCRNVKSPSNVQNEPISDAMRAAPDASEGCERQSSRGVVIVQPAAIPREGTKVSRDDGRRVEGGGERM